MLLVWQQVVGTPPGNVIVQYDWRLAKIKITVCVDIASVSYLGYYVLCILCEELCFTL